MYDIDLDVSDPSSLDRTQLRQAIERNMLTEVQLMELGLDHPTKVQAVLRGEDASIHIDPASVQASGNIMTLTPDEEALIQRRRDKAAQEPTPKLRSSSAIADDDEDEEEGEGDGDGDDEGLTPPYDAEGITNDDLRAELSDRELPVDGNKAALIARLEEDDALKQSS